MDFNSELNNYGIPTLNYDRSTYNYIKRVKTTGNVGEIIPFYVNLLVQPGDTFKISVTDFERLTTSKFPTMDNLYRSIFFFSVPWDAVWTNAYKFWGESEDADFDNIVEYTIPSFEIGASDTIGNRDVLNRLGMPHKASTGQFANQDTTILFQRLTHNMYLHIYNNYFRDQSYTPAYKFSKGDEDIAYSSYTMPKTLLKACRFHDYFNGIPKPQYGDQSTISLGSEAPIVGDGKSLGLTDGTNTFGLDYGSSQYYTALKPNVNAYGQNVGTTNTGSVAGLTVNEALGITTDPEKSGAIAKLSDAVSAGINVLRMDIAEQHIKEKLAWYGRLYQNIVQSLWGVEANQQDLRLPVFLGATRAPLNMDTVLQTSSTDSTSPQGEPAGYSATINGQQEYFTKSFTEHSIIMGLIVVRQDHTYSQGINCQNTKRRKYDFYWNDLAGLGAQDILNSEIYATGTSTDSQKWACKPAWQEYRVEPDEVTGQLAPTATGTLVNYTYADYYSSLPVAGTNWLEETDIYVDRTLTTQANVADQLMFDFNINITKVTEVPAYNLPGINRI